MTKLTGDVHITLHTGVANLERRTDHHGGREWYGGKNREHDNDSAVCVCSVCWSAIGPLYSHQSTHRASTFSSSLFWMTRITILVRITKLSSNMKRWPMSVSNLQNKGPLNTAWFRSSLGRPIIIIYVYLFESKSYNFEEKKQCTLSYRRLTWLNL